MFTGLIRELGTVVRREPAPGGALLVVEAPLLAPGATLGDSICLDGACLTVSRRDGSRLTFDVSAETLRRTTLGGLSAGDRVNLEDALTPSSKMGGHHVLGHVDGVGVVASRRRAGDTLLLTLRLPGELARHLVSKGSLAVDGISLTINEVRGATCTVTLIPHTLSSVVLGSKKAGAKINVETDILIKAVEKLLHANGTLPERRRDDA